MLITEIFPNELRRCVPPLHSQKDIRDPIVHLKFFSNTRWISYVTEGSLVDDDFVFFGFVVGWEEEWGEFFISELNASARSGVSIERDVQFKPKRFSQIISRER
jgi:hypothetical protein